MKRIMGIETEYGILGADAHKVLDNFSGFKKTHENTSPTNNSIIAGMSDVGHIGGDYEGQKVDVDIASGIGFSRAGWSGNVAMATITGFENAWESGYAASGRYGSYGGSYSSYFGRDDMLANGARFYIDMGHPEYSTPECSNPVSLVIADKAGERILEQASCGIARIFKNNTDGTNSYGCHENYFLLREKVGNKEQFGNLAQFMTPFFISRIVFTGAGKIGFRYDAGDFRITSITRDILDNYASIGKLVGGGGLSDLYARVKAGLEEVVGRVKDGEVIFQLSQRADFFKELIGLQTTYNRPIINTRDEALADSSKFMRFHVINGDANMSEVANYLKLGTCSLALDLFEQGFVGIKLEDAVGAFSEISKDISLAARIKTELGEMTALEIQRMYLDTAEKFLRGRDVLTDDILDRWKFVLGCLENNPMQSPLTRQIDWVIKKNLIDGYMRKTGKSMNDATVRNIDLQYHEVNRQTGLFYMLQNKGLVDRIVTDSQIENAVDNAPADTRAWLRGELIRRNEVSKSDWDTIRLKGEADEISLKDPFRGTQEELGELFTGALTQEQLMAELKARGYVEERKVYTKYTGGKSNVTRTKTTRKQQRKLPGFSAEHD